TPVELRPAPEVGEFRVSGSGFRVPSGTTRNSEPGTRNPLPLAGVRVLELTNAGAGPWAGRHLAYAGAEAIRIESRRFPDFPRLYVPPKDPQSRRDEQGPPSIIDWNGGKLSAAIEATEAEGRELALRLVRLADVVLENNSVGLPEKLGLGYDAL